MTTNQTLADEIEGLAEKATAGPWAHRPQEYDDWGVIRMAERDQDGFMRHVCKCAYVASPEELCEHRRNGTDPAGDTASLIVALRNNLPAILAALRAQPSPAPEPDLYQYHPKTRTNVKHFGAAPLNDMEKEIGWTETPLWKRPPKEPGRERVDALVEALEKIMPISVEDGHDYASVYFTDGAKHRTQAMTMNPQDWLDIAAAIAAMKGEG